MIGVDVEPLLSRAITHRGAVRAANQDAVLEMPEIGLWVVADGMGGHQYGEVASQAIVESMQALGEYFEGEELLARVKPVLEHASRELFGFAEEADVDVVGSTVVVLVLEGEQYHCFWVGDSRAYLLRGDQLWKLTEDHTERPSELGASAGGALTRAVGAFPDLEVDYVGGTLFQDDIFLLCSDGLNKVLTDQRIGETLAQSPADRACTVLVDAVLQEGAPDNVSCVTVFVRGGSG